MTNLSKFQGDINTFLMEAALTLRGPVAPLEQFVDQVIDFSIGVANRIAIDGPLSQVYEDIRNSSPHVTGLDLPTPFGQVRTPTIGLPELKRLTLDSRKREAFKATVAIDLSGIVGIIPYIGDVIADIAEDTYGAQLRELLTSEELNLYTEFDKLSPSSVALARTFMKLAI